MPRLTTAKVTFEISRYGRSGPQNERCIQAFIDSLPSLVNDKYMDVRSDGYGTGVSEWCTESAD
jgi:hypothetical protein